MNKTQISLCSLILHPQRQTGNSIHHHHHLFASAPRNGIAWAIATNHIADAPRPVIARSVLPTPRATAARHPHVAAQGSIAAAATARADGDARTREPGRAWMTRNAARDNCAHNSPSPLCLAQVGHHELSCLLPEDSSAEPFGTRHVRLIHGISAGMPSGTKTVMPSSCDVIFTCDARRDDAVISSSDQ